MIGTRTQRTPTRRTTAASWNSFRQTAPGASKNIMKTTTLSESSRLHRAQLSIAAILLAALCAGSNTPAAAANTNTNNASPPCQTTARLVRQSAINQAQADYWLEIA